MTFNELLQKSEEKGHEAGLAEGREVGLARGEQRMLHLISLMAENGEAGLISRLSEDPDFLFRMYEKYQISI